MIQTFNWLLTRKCNMNCQYCRISKDYDSPKGYPSGKSFYTEMHKDYLIECLKRAKAHNPDAFHLFYGGEPFLYEHFSEILSFVNKENIFYTIISNNTNGIQEQINAVFEDVGEIKGFTSSVDPIDPAKCLDLDRVAKSIQGMNRLIELKKKYPNMDVVAEITMDGTNFDRVYDLVKELADNGVMSDITFVDIAKTRYYDFSNVTERNMLISRDIPIRNVLEKLAKDFPNYIHMADKLLPALYDILPVNLDCKIPEKLTHLTIDSDGSIRLCLRIRGINTPKLKFLDYFTEEGKYLNLLYKNLKDDKVQYCYGCNWTCPVMANLIEEGIMEKETLLHT